MRISRFRLYKALIGAGLGIAVGVAIATDTAIIALAAVVAAIIFAFILERSNKEIVRDERIAQISAKASSMAFTIIIIAAAAGSLISALFSSHLPENLVMNASLLGYFVCIAILLQMGFYLYYSRKL